MIRLFRNLQNCKDIFKKKSKILGGPHQVAPPLDYKKEGVNFRIKLR